MSYSFSVRGTTKAEVSKKVADELAKVVISQGMHAADQDQAQTASNNFVELLADDDTKDISVTVSGWLQWNSDSKITAANVSVTASLIAKE